MSKSKGNVVTPMALFDRYGTDAVRYWAIAARPGVDTAFSEDQMKVGRRLATKLLNVTKFVLGIVGETGRQWRRSPAVTDPVDRAMLARLDAVIAEATRAFEGYDYARALERTEAFFWWFCDDYVELVKGRAYGGRGDDGGRVGAGGAVDRPRRAAAAAGADAARSPPRRRGAGRTTTSVHAAAWPAPTGARRRRRRRSRRRQRGARPRPAGQDRGQGEPAGRRSSGCASARPDAAIAAVEAAAADLRDAAHDRRARPSPPAPALTVEAELAAPPADA